MDYIGKYLDEYGAMYYPNKKMEKQHIRPSMLVDLFADVCWAV
jgi:hypothetical protein